MSEKTEIGKWVCELCNVVNKGEKHWLGGSCICEKCYSEMMNTHIIIHHIVR